MTAKKKEEAEDNLKFEEALERLERIVEKLESGDVPLDEALKQYEEGVKLSRRCTQKLAEVERKVEILTKTLAGGLKAEPFDEALAEGDETSTAASEKSRAGTRSRKRAVRDGEDEGGLLL